ncbi:MAG: PIG-L family deacetylase [Chloroflexi bacterium]|nr:PIG-L family deacetylase [Chloroflexota bacterium]
MKTLVVAAHPDDEVLGCGGTAAGLSESGDLWIGILGEGVAARYGLGEEAPKADLERLKSQAERAGKILGAKEVVFASLPDNRFDTVAMLDIVKVIEKWIKDFGPEVVYTHHNGDLNVDHSATFRAVLTATRPMIGETVRDVYAFEIASSTEWAFQSIGQPFHPNTFVDVTATIDRKIEALEAYTGEVREFPHPRSPDALRANAKRWGAAVGVQAAEAFELIRAVR